MGRNNCNFEPFFGNFGSQCLYFGDTDWASTSEERNFIPIILILKYSFILCFCVCTYVFMCICDMHTSAWDYQKRELGPLKVELHVLDWASAWVLGTKPGSSLRAVSALISCAIFLGPIVLIYISLSLKNLKYFIICPSHLVGVIRCYFSQDGGFLLCQVPAYFPI